VRPASAGSRAASATRLVFKPGGAAGDPLAVIGLLAGLACGRGGEAWPGNAGGGESAAWLRASSVPQ